MLLLYASAAEVITCCTSIVVDPITRYLSQHSTFSCTTVNLFQYFGLGPSSEMCKDAPQWSIPVFKDPLAMCQVF